VTPLQRPQPVVDLHGDQKMQFVIIHRHHHHYHNHHRQQQQHLFCTNKSTSVNKQKIIMPKSYA